LAALKRFLEYKFSLTSHLHAHPLYVFSHVEHVKSIYPIVWVLSPFPVLNFMPTAIYSFIFSLFTQFF
jgi:hypothetical protein